MYLIIDTYGNIWEQQDGKWQLIETGRNIPLICKLRRLDKDRKGVDNNLPPPEGLGSSVATSKGAFSYE